MAQFGHPDLGGNGQWMRNGMIMVGDMFNHALKAKVDALCQALLPHLQDADAARSDPGHSEEPETRSSKRTKHEIEGMGQSTARRESSAWWPSEYTSSPAATGGQNDMRYAYFPREKALVVEQEGKIVVYDATGHEFHGFGQQQTSSSGFKLRSTLGSIDLSKLPRKK